MYDLMSTNAVCICSVGTYGTVFKAKNRETHEIVALKRVRLDDDDEVYVSMDIRVSAFASKQLATPC